MARHHRATLSNARNNRPVPQKMRPDGDVIADGVAFVKVAE
jgi:hypothetical protein